MGKHDGIWQAINDLDDRLTRLEERATPQVETPTATIPPRQWRVGDVVRLEDSCYLNEKFRAMVGTHHTITGGNEHYAKIGVHLWPASALTLIRAVDEVEDTHTATAWRNLETMCTDLEREVERLTAEPGDAIVKQKTFSEKHLLEVTIHELRAENARLITERDELRARIEAGRIMYGGMYGHQNKFEMWTFEHVDTDTMTARLIDIAPIAADERRGVITS